MSEIAFGIEDDDDGSCSCGDPNCAQNIVVPRRIANQTIVFDIPTSNETLVAWPFVFSLN